MILGMTGAAHWHFTRRVFLAGLAAQALPAVAQDAYVGQMLVAEKTTSPLLGEGAPATSHWRFKSSGPQPILRAKQGQEVRFRVVNTLDETLWLHFFGVRGPSDMMTVQVQPGESNAIEVVFTPPDAGTFWFGPLLQASKHRDMGLYGMLIVDEAESDLQLVDVPLIIDDWKLDDAGVIETGFGNLEAAIGEGRLGNWFTVNGQLKPRITLPQGKTARLRLLNAANTRTINLLFKGADVSVIALDGQPVKIIALGIEALKLAPGQRADVVLSNGQEQVVIALDLFEDVVELAFLMQQGTPAALAADFQLKANPLPAVDAAAVPRTIPIVIEGGIKGGLKSARVGSETLELRELLEKGLAYSLNGSSGPGGLPLFAATKGEVLLLAFDNRASLAQVLHVHGHVWHLVEQDNQVVDGQSWRDTAVIPGLTQAKYLFVADNPGAWAIQSLIAERSDAGMLGAFTVADMP